MRLGVQTQAARICGLCRKTGGNVGKTGCGTWERNPQRFQHGDGAYPWNFGENVHRHVDLSTNVFHGTEHLPWPIPHRHQPTNRPGRPLAPETHHFLYSSTSYLENKFPNFSAVRLATNGDLKEGSTVALLSNSAHITSLLVAALF